MIGEEVIKPEVVELVLEYQRNPFAYELRSVWINTYKDYPDQWDEIFAQGGRE